ncbi:MAG TPA: LPXTG cell wall anchor domain-containing protein, partial [Candidatus Tetragenococcus pullicola]|nr:LPXTG cell wall anchor domain-containing protein [Candidatus Tetragenococcus pullicola]
AKQLVKETIDNDSATQEEVDAAKEEMTKAEESLVDISELNQLIADSKEKAEKEYTSKSWKAFLEALDKAKSMVATEEATQQEVNDVYNTLEKAIKELEKKQAKAPTNPGKPNNSGNNKGKGRLPQTGEKDHSMVTIIGGITLLLVGVLSYMKHKVANKMQD